MLLDKEWAEYLYALSKYTRLFEETASLSAKESLIQTDIDSIDLSLATWTTAFRNQETTLRNYLANPPAEKTHQNAVINLKGTQVRLKELQRQKQALWKEKLVCREQGAEKAESAYELKRKARSAWLDAVRGAYGFGEYEWIGESFHVYNPANNQVDIYIYVAM